MPETILTSIAVLFISYLLGSISFSRISLRLLGKEKDGEIVRLKEMHDGKEEINLPMGANTVSIKHGSAAGCAVSLLDILKGAAPTLAARLIFPVQPYYVIAALGVVAGHIWPVYFRFSGGSGIATMMGALLVIDWLSVPVSVLVSLVIGLLLLRNMVAIFFILILSYIPWMWFRFGDFIHIAFAFMLLVLFLLAMIPSIRVYQHKIKEGTAMEDMRSAMESMPMGRGMNRIIEFMRPKTKEQK